MSFCTSLSIFLLGHRPKLIFDWHTQFLVICTFVICECPPSIYLECKKRFFSDPSLICAITCNLKLVSNLTETTQFSKLTWFTKQGLSTWHLKQLLFLSIWYWNTAIVISISMNILYTSIGFYVVSRTKI